jgi:MoxR-like ATPase
MNTFGFELYSPFEPTPDQAGRKQALSVRTLPVSLGSHKEGAGRYQPDEGLMDAVNVALAVGAPLLLTGEPGTGKTQLASHLAGYFGIPLHPLHVRSDSTADDLLYRFDAVAYLHAANDPVRRGGSLSRGEFVEPGPLWQAYLEKDASVVLIDEIDKAPRDFPNDLLDVLDQHKFYVREKGEWVHCGQRPPPIVVITSNSERRLPEPFLRRCIFHHIRFTEALVLRAVKAHVDSFPNLGTDVQEAALQRFFELRGRDIRKPPATAELLVWLAVLAAQGTHRAQDLRSCPLAKLPALSTLVKDRDDLAQIG